MSKNQYIVLRVLIIILMAFTAAFAQARGGWWWLTVPLVVAVAIFVHMRYLSIKKVKEVMIDERSRIIQEKASRVAIIIFVTAAVIIGAVLVVLTYHTDLGVDFSQAGSTLVYSSISLAILVIILRFYYDRKL